MTIVNETRTSHGNGYLTTSVGAERNVRLEIYTDNGRLYTDLRIWDQSFLGIILAEYGALGRFQGQLYHLVALSSSSNLPSSLQLLHRHLHYRCYPTVSAGLFDSSENNSYISCTKNDLIYIRRLQEFRTHVWHICARYM